MGLHVDMQFGRAVLADLYVRIGGASATKGVAFYHIELFDGRGGERVNVLPPEAVYFTFGEPQRRGLSGYDVTGNQWEQCYNDLKNRFARGLLPWAAAMREEDGTSVEPITDLSDIAVPSAPMLSIDDALATLGNPENAVPSIISEPETLDPSMHRDGQAAETVAPLPSPQLIDVELAEIEDVEAARTIVLQRLMALSLAKAGLTMQTYLRMAELAAIQADPDATPEQKRDAELEAEQFKDRATAAQAYELARQLKAAKVATLSTIEQLRVYDIYEGWPP